jgi:hypothetical protein
MQPHKQQQQQQQQQNNMGQNANKNIILVHLLRKCLRSAQHQYDSQFDDLSCI